ncbi:MAG: hypothetical protein R2844_15460 [Caldilineales bacterium]
MVYLVDENRVTAAFAPADAIRSESKQAVDRLHEPGRPGRDADRRQQGSGRCGGRRRLDIDDYIAEVLPENKDEKVSGFAKPKGARSLWWAMASTTHRR